MAKESNKSALGRDGQLKRPKHSPDGLRRLREATLRNQPWKHATGPKTPEGKARVAQNGRYAQKDALSRRQLAKQMAECDALAANLAELRRRIGGLMQG